MTCCCEKIAVSCFMLQQGAPDKNYPLALCGKKNKLSFIFFLSGGGKLTITRSGIVNTFLADANQYAIIPPFLGHMGYQPNSTSTVIRIDICQHLFATLIGEGIYTKQVANFLNSLDKDSLSSLIKYITPQIRSAIYQLKYFASLKHPKKLHCASISLKVLMLLIQGEEISTISSTDVTRVERVKHLLRTNLEKPPTFRELAATAEMNLVRFTKTFRALTGTTPFGYLREQRLSRAMHLLTEDGLNVTDAAFEVGYTSVSYFCKMFYKQYGVKPSAMKQETFTRESKVYGSPRNAPATKNNSSLVLQPAKPDRSFIAEQRLLHHSPAVTVSFLAHDLSNNSKPLLYQTPPEKPYTLVFNIQGEGTLFEREKKSRDPLEITALSFFVTPAQGEGVRIVYPRNQHVVFIEIQIRKNEIDSIPYGPILARELEKVEQDKLKVHQRSFINPISAQVQLILRQMCTLYKDYPLKGFFYNSMVLGILTHIIDEQKGCTTCCKQRYSAHRDRIQQALKIMGSCHNTELILPDIAKEVGLSQPHFNRVFRSLTGATPRIFLKQKKMELSLSYLINDSKSIGEIADIVGYRSKSHFTKAFTAYFGIKPSFFQDKRI